MKYEDHHNSIESQYVLIDINCLARTFSCLAGTKLMRYCTAGLALQQSSDPVWSAP